MPRSTTLLEDGARRVASTSVGDGHGGCANEEAQTSPLQMLEVALATELTSMLRCRRFHFSVREQEHRPIAIAFLVHSVRAQRNADSLAERIVALQGQPRFGPDSLHLSLTSYAEPDSLGGLIDTAISAERFATHRYSQYLDTELDRDSTASHLLRSMVASGAAFIEEMESNRPRA
jgi:bacterioferritin